MDEEQIKALLAEFKTELSAQFSKQLEKTKEDLTEQTTVSQQGLAASLTARIKKAQADLVKAEPPKDSKVQPAEEAKPNLELEALQNDLKVLTETYNREKESAHRLAARNAITGALNEANVKPLSLLQDHLFSKLAPSEQEGRWYTKADDGTAKSLNTAVTDFLATDEGKYFLPASSVQGSGVREAKPTPIVGTGEVSTSQALLDSFSQI